VGEEEEEEQKEEHDDLDVEGLFKATAMKEEEDEGGRGGRSLKEEEEEEGEEERQGSLRRSESVRPFSNLGANVSNEGLVSKKEQL